MPFDAGRAGGAFDLLELSFDDLHYGSGPVGRHLAQQVVTWVAGADHTRPHAHITHQATQRTVR